MQLKRKKIHNNESLLIFEQELELIERELKENVIRTANSKQNPQNPLRPEERDHLRFNWQVRTTKF